MPNTGDICFAAKIELAFLPDAPTARFSGAYVNVWIFAPDESAAKRQIVDQSLAVHRANVVSFESVGPANPMAIEVPVNDEGDSDETRPITEPEMIELFTKHSVVFGTFFTWRRKHWWQFWNR